MLMERRAVTGLRVFLVVMFALLVMLQTLSFPGQFRHMASEHPEHADWRWPATAAVFVLIACVQVVIVAIWKLLTRVVHDRIFSPESFAWVDAIIYAIAAGWVVLVGIDVTVAFHADDPGAPVALFLLTVGVTVVGLLMIVMRALLRQATALRTDLEAVI
ncbi:DUF2975 domain-containing protein [Sporichthya brevicatena]|uniref:DUF2975 domain-containing protein n=1 Tax=Sporichthya brevicatena TaxID=171442 RepID=UPI0031D968CA